MPLQAGQHGPCCAWLIHAQRFGLELGTFLNFFVCWQRRLASCHDVLHGYSSSCQYPHLGCLPGFKHSCRVSGLLGIGMIYWVVPEGIRGYSLIAHTGLAVM